MILTVHDELLFEAPIDQADEVAALVRDKMSSAVKLSVPLDVDVGIGRELEGSEVQKVQVRVSAVASGSSVISTAPSPTAHSARSCDSGLRALLGGSERTRSGMMPCSTSLSRSARSAAPSGCRPAARAPSRRAASHAADDRPRRAGPRRPVGGRRRRRVAGQLARHAIAQRANTVMRGSRSSGIGLPLDGAAPPVEHRLAGRSPSRRAPSMPLSNSAAAAPKSSSRNSASPSAEETPTRSRASRLAARTVPSASRAALRSAGSARSR